MAEEGAITKVLRVDICSNMHCYNKVEIYGHTPLPPFCAICREKAKKEK